MVTAFSDAPLMDEVVICGLHEEGGDSHDMKAVLGTPDLES